MDNYDIKKAHKALYSPTAKCFTLVTVPTMRFLMVDGHGDPNTATAYLEAVQALYTVSYAIRAITKRTLNRVHTVAPLEGLWSADDYADFATRNKGAWHWTMMIAQPEWITPELVADGVAAAPTKGLVALDLVRFQEYAEGRCVQILHVGAYDDEAPILARLHDEYLPRQGLVPTGRHHEIYLSDPRKTEPRRLKTILRQPVAQRRPPGYDGVTPLR